MCFSIVDHLEGTCSRQGFRRKDILILSAVSVPASSHLTVVDLSLERSLSILKTWDDSKVLVYQVFLMPAEEAMLESLFSILGCRPTIYVALLHVL